MCRDLLLFPGVSVQISAIFVTFSVTDHKHLLLICCDIFCSTFLLSSNVWKFKIKSSSFDTSKHASRITLIVPIHDQITKKQGCMCKFSFSVVIMKCLPIENIILANLYQSS